MSNENTPSNAGKEQMISMKKTKLQKCIERLRASAPKTQGRAAPPKCNCPDSYSFGHEPGCPLLADNEAQNNMELGPPRTTPPTQSQVWETPETDRHDFDESCGYDVPWSDFCRDLERRLTAAQRENDRLRSALSQIAELNGDGDAQQFKLTRFQAAQIARKALSDAARAATEEGKRG